MTYKIIAFACILIDTLTYILMESLDLYYLPSICDFVLIFEYFIKVSVSLIICYSLLYILLYDKLSLMLIGPILYMILGLLYFIYLLINNINYYPMMRNISRPGEFYEYKIYIYILTSNIISCLSKFAAGICLIFIRNFLSNLQIKRTLILIIRL